VLQLLIYTNSQSASGNLYGGNSTLVNQANTVYDTDVSSRGDISMLQNAPITPDEQVLDSVSAASEAMLVASEGGAGKNLTLIRAGTGLLTALWLATFSAQDWSGSFARAMRKADAKNRAKDLQAQKRAIDLTFAC
jgi:hypothetical protein